MSRSVFEDFLNEAAREAELHSRERAGNNKKGTAVMVETVEDAINLLKLMPQNARIRLAMGQRNSDQLVPILVTKEIFARTTDGNVVQQAETVVYL